MNFEELDLNPSLLASILKCGFKECTNIQEKVIPLVLQGKDVAGLSQTGTGKTAAYLIPLVERILCSLKELSHPKHLKPLNSNANLSEELSYTERHHPKLPISKGLSREFRKESSSKTFSAKCFPSWRKSQYVLILVPTRELADQVQKEIERLGASSSIQSIALYGGMPYDLQKEALKNEVHFVVATPGRLIDLHKECSLNLSQVCAIVFDEADRMFDMGFKNDVKYILRRIPKERQFLSFSATLNFDVLNMSYQFGSTPIEVDINRDQIKAENVEDAIFHIGKDEKPRYLLSLFKKVQNKKNIKQAIVFSNFKHNVEKIANFLNQNHIPSMSISSLLNQNQRNRIVSSFKSSESRNVLVATDVAARGLDIKGVDLVINYDLPDNPENYVHRIGRTGRAGDSGIALSLVDDLSLDALHRIEDYLGHKLSLDWLEDADFVKGHVKMTYDDLQSFFKKKRRKPLREGYKKRLRESRKKESDSKTSPTSSRYETNGEQKNFNQRGKTFKNRKKKKVSSNAKSFKLRERHKKSFKKDKKLKNPPIKGWKKVSKLLKKWFSKA